MAGNDLKIWQNHLLPIPSHMVDAKFDLILRPISHGNPAMPYGQVRSACLWYNIESYVSLDSLCVTMFGSV